MKTLWLASDEKYDGTQLHSLFAYLNHGILGDSMVAWRGACEVSFEHMVDGEDLLAKSQICGADMVHFIGEFFASKLEFAVAMQRLMACQTIEILRKHLEKSPGISNQFANSNELTNSNQLANANEFANSDQLANSRAARQFSILRREGDDVFLGEGKLSISIATVSPVSALIHFAVNVTNEGTPVRTASLNDLNINPDVFAHALLAHISAEVISIRQATQKVRWVK